MDLIEKILMWCSQHPLIVLFCLMMLPLLHILFRNIWYRYFFNKFLEEYRNLDIETKNQDFSEREQAFKDFRKRVKEKIPYPGPVGMIGFYREYLSFTSSVYRKSMGAERFIAADKERKKRLKQIEEAGGCLILGIVSDPVKYRNVPFR